MDDVQNSAAIEPAAAQVEQTAAPQAPQSADLDSLSEFSFQGQKYTPTQLAKMLGDYQRMSQTLPEVEKYREYAENFEIDLEKVARNPALADQFKQLYPKQFHAAVDKIVGGARPAASQENARAQVPNEFTSELQALKAELNEFKQEKYQAQVAQQEAYLQKVVDPLFEKYPYAKPREVQNAVFAQAQAMVEQGYKMTDAAWERLVKETHLAIKKQSDDLRAIEIKKQTEVGAKGADTGAGGSPPGQAPARARNFREAEIEALRQIKAL